MGHNLHGDVTEADLELAKELLEMEDYFFDNLGHYSPSLIARIFVCLAHDWYELGDDDKGSLILENANVICPGYFDNQIKIHMKEDPEFKRLVDNLINNILILAKSVIGE